MSCKSQENNELHEINIRKTSSDIILFFKLFAIVKERKRFCMKYLWLKIKPFGQIYVWTIKGLVIMFNEQPGIMY